MVAKSNYSIRSTERTTLMLKILGNPKKTFTLLGLLNSTIKDKG